MVNSWKPFFICLCCQNILQTEHVAQSPYLRVTANLVTVRQGCNSMNADITLSRTACTISLDIFVWGFGHNPGFRRWQLSSRIESFSNFPFDFIRNTIKTILWMVHPYHLCSNAFSHKYSWRKALLLEHSKFLTGWFWSPALLSMEGNVFFSKQIICV